MDTKVNIDYQFRVLKAKGKEKYYPQIKYPGSVEWSFDIHPEFNSVIVRDTYDDAVQNWKMDLRYRSYIHGIEDIPLVREDPDEKALLGKWGQIHESSFKNFEETKKHLIQRLDRVFGIINPVDSFDSKFAIFDWDVCNWDGNRCIHLYVFNYNYSNPSFADFFFPYELLNYANENDIREDFKAFLKKYPNTFGFATIKK